MYKRSAEGWTKHWDFILLDTICLQVAFILAYYIRFGTRYIVYSQADYKGIGLWLALFSVSVAVIFNTMHTVLRRTLAQEIRRTLAQCLMVFAAIIIFLFSIKDSEAVSRIVLYVTIGIYTLLSFATRMLYKRFLIKHKFFGKKREMLLVVTDKAGAQKAIEAFRNRPEESINVCGVVLVDGEATDGEVDGIPVVATLENAASYICQKWIDEVYIAVSDYAAMPVELMQHCAEMGVTVHQQLILPSGVQGKQQVERIARQPVLTSSISMAKPWQLLVKRIIDIIGGALLSLLALITIIIVTPFIKKASPGPVLLKHKRVGQNGRVFKAFTIRTMHIHAEERLKRWLEHNQMPEGKPLTIDIDPRIIGNKTLPDGTHRTGIGYIIRKLSLDDLPLAFNVLIGQMSLVGTRAPSIDEWEQYEFHHRARLACKPGITGLWQASGRSRMMSFEEATTLDTEYIANWSLSLDGRILLCTIKADKNTKNTKSLRKGKSGFRNV